MVRFALALAVALVAGCAPSTSWDRSSFSYGSDPLQTYTVYRPADSSLSYPAFVFVHGGGFAIGSPSDADDIADTLCRHGFVVISIGYRLTSFGAEWPAQIDDVHAALRHIRAHAELLRITPRIGIGGASAGAMLAMLAHLEPDSDGWRPDCCVDLSGEMKLQLGQACFSDFTRLTDALFGAAPSEELLVSASPITYARPDAHVLIIHSTGDTNVYVANSDCMASALVAAGAEVTYDRELGSAHGNDLWDQSSQARGETIAFLQRLRLP